MRDALPALLDELGAEVMLDVGCGDLTWMRATQIRQQYIGVDIVPAVIEANRLHFASERRRWELCDAVEAELPDADVVFCREMLFHLGFADAMAVLRNVLSKPRRWLILTTNSSTLFNSDIQSGDYRPLNLERAPFRLPPPQGLISDDRVAAGRRLGVWRAADVASDLGIGSRSA